MNSLQWTAASLEEASMVAATWPGDRLPEITSLGNSENLNIIICYFVLFFFFIPACL